MARGPSQEEIVERLMAEWGYRPHVAEGLADKLRALSGPVAAAFANWWKTGVLPELEVEGYSVNRLVGLGFHVPGTFPLLDWLLREPERARKNLLDVEKRGFEKRVGGEFGFSQSPGHAGDGERQAMPSQDKISAWLMDDWGYSSASAGRMAPKLRNLSDPVAAAFVSWWQSGEIPEIEIEGYSPARLMGLKFMLPAAFSTLDELACEPERALAGLREMERRGYDKVLLEDTRKVTLNKYWDKRIDGVKLSVCRAEDNSSDRIGLRLGEDEQVAVAAGDQIEIAGKPWQVTHLQVRSQFVGKNLPDGGVEILAVTLTEL